MNQNGQNAYSGAIVRFGSPEVKKRSGGVCDILHINFSGNRVDYIGSILTGQEEMSGCVGKGGWTTAGLPFFRPFRKVK